MHTKRAPANSLLKRLVDLLQPKAFDRKELVVRKAFKWIDFARRELENLENPEA